MSLSRIKNLLATSPKWYNVLAIATLEEAESSRKDMSIYEELKRKQPELYSQLLISEATEYLDREIKVISFVTTMTSMTAFYSYTFGALHMACGFALSSGLTFYGMTLSSRTKNLIISTQLESVHSQLQRVASLESLNKNT